MSNRRKAKPKRKVLKSELGVLNVGVLAEETGLTIEETEEAIKWLKDNQFLATYEEQDGRTLFLPTVPDDAEE